MKNTVLIVAISILFLINQDVFAKGAVSAACPVLAGKYHCGNESCGITENRTSDGVVVYDFNLVGYSHMAIVKTSSLGVSQGNGS